MSDTPSTPRTGGKRIAHWINWPVALGLGLLTMLALFNAGSDVLGDSLAGSFEILGKVILGLVAFVAFAALVMLLRKGGLRLVALLFALVALVVTAVQLGFLGFSIGGAIVLVWLTSAAIYWTLRSAVAVVDEWPNSLRFDSGPSWRLAVDSSLTLVGLLRAAWSNRQVRRQSAS